MAQSQTPAALARRMARFVYTTLRASPKDYIGSRGLVRFDKGVLLYVEGFLPTETLAAQLRNNKRRARAMARMEYPEQMEALAEAWELSKRDAYARGEMYHEIVNLLRGGAEPRDVKDYLSRRQRWPCFALAANQKELEGEMATRYALGRCEMDFACDDLPGGVIVICRMIPQEW